MYSRDSMRESREGGRGKCNDSGDGGCDRRGGAVDAHLAILDEGSRRDIPV